MELIARLTGILEITLLLIAILSKQSDGYSKLLSMEHHNKGAVPAKIYTVNLDLAPQKRWKELLSHFDPDFVKEGIKNLISTVLPSVEMRIIAEKIAGELDRYISQPYSDEIRGVSEAIGITLGDVVLTNIVYDITAYAKKNSSKACTSIVTRNQAGQIIHGRNLDYDVMPAALRNLTVQVDFQQNGKSLYMATSYVGYIGVITGSRHGAFSISGDERDMGSAWSNLINALEGDLPTFFVQRKVLQESSDYASALNQLMNTPTIAPVYFILGGLKENEGSIIVRDGKNVISVVRLGDDLLSSWFIVETNYDPWVKPPKSDDRRDAAIASMVKIGAKHMNKTALYNVLSTPPVFNSRTTYTTIMSPAQSYFSSTIRFDAPTSITGL